MDRAAVRAIHGASVAVARRAPMGRAGRARARGAGGLALAGWMPMSGPAADARALDPVPDSESGGGGAVPVRMWVVTEADGFATLSIGRWVNVWFPRTVVIRELAKDDQGLRKSAVFGNRV